MSPHRVDEAYEAIRAHLHERPYTNDPSRIYNDLGALSSLLTALNELALDIFHSADKATGSDDRQTREHKECVRWHINDVDFIGARKLVDSAHEHCSHLIFASRSGE